MKQAMVVIDWPETCYNCEFCRHISNPDYYSSFICGVSGETIYENEYKKYKLPDCPLIPVTKGDNK